MLTLHTGQNKNCINYHLKIGDDNDIYKVKAPNCYKAKKLLSSYLNFPISQISLIKIS